jgi:hypothetical protein
VSVDIDECVLHEICETEFPRNSAEPYQRTVVYETPDKKLVQLDVYERGDREYEEVYKFVDAAEAARLFRMFGRPLPRRLQSLQAPAAASSAGATASTDGRKLTPCESDCLLTVGEIGKRCTGREIIEAMSLKGRQHGRSTIKEALAKLVQDGLLTRGGRGRASRGYGLPEWDSARG